MLFWGLLILFSKSTFSKKSYRNTFSVKQFGSRSKPDILGPNCLQRLSANDTHFDLILYVAVKKNSVMSSWVQGLMCVTTAGRVNLNANQKFAAKNSAIGPEFFYKLIYKPSYCNFPESRKKNYFKKIFFYFIRRL